MSSWKWDKWQLEILEYEGDIVLHAGRQVGKSEVIAEKIKRTALKYPGIKFLIIAGAARQSSLIYEKTIAYMTLEERETGTKIFKTPPTRDKAVLENGSSIVTVPVGRTGYLIKGHTCDVLVEDEAAQIPDLVQTAVTPMLAVSESTRKFGWTWLLSTPFGKTGYFYESSLDPNFRVWHVNAEDCPRWSKEKLAREKKKMTKQEYMQEIQGLFTDDYHQLFPTKLIKECMTIPSWTKETDSTPNASFYLGLDFAGYGGDQNAWAIAELDRSLNVKIVHKHTTDHVSSTDTIKHTINLDRLYNFKKIFTDSSGLGSPITDTMQTHFGRRVLGLNNSSKRVRTNPEDDESEEIKRGILKEDLYTNTLMLMETGRLKMIIDDDIARSLKSVTFEHSKEKGSRNIKIYGKYTHIAEAIVRACWCIKERGLNVYLY